MPQFTTPTLPYSHDFAMPTTRGCPVTAPKASLSRSSRALCLVARAVRRHEVTEAIRTALCSRLPVIDREGVLCRGHLAAVIALGAVRGHQGRQHRVVPVAGTLLVLRPRQVGIG